MSAASTPQVRRRSVLRSEAEEARVSPLELFFDLVFVFALTQVTRGMAEDPTFAGMVHGLLILVPLYWAWSGYTWLTSTVDPELVLTRLVMFGGMAGMALAALATPGAFGDDTLAWGIGYFVVRALHVALFALAARGNADLWRQVRSLVRAIAPGPVLILVAGLAFEGTTRDVLWAAAVVLDFAVVLAAGVEGWVVHAAHFSERFGLILIVALGESVVAIGAGEFDLGVAEIAAATIALITICMLWWAYFDVYAIVAERRFTEAEGKDQLLIARDSYALLHLPMIVGIVFFALGVKKVLEHTGDPLKHVPAFALCAGLSIYALAHVAFRLRNTGMVSVPRIITALACAAVTPIAVNATALIALTLLAAIWITLISYETLRYHEFRTRVRAASH